MTLVAFPKSLGTTLEEEENNIHYSSESPATWTKEVEAYDLSSWQIQTIFKIIKLGELKYDWDSYGSPPPSHEIVNQAIALVEFLKIEDLPVPEVIPTSGGGIQLEWNEEEKDLEIEVNKNGEIEYLQCIAGDPIEEGLVKEGSYLLWLVLWVFSV